jgi:hypothetical protein
MRNCAAPVKANSSMPTNTAGKWLLSITLLKIDNYKQGKAFYLWLKSCRWPEKSDRVDPSNKLKIAKKY